MCEGNIVYRLEIDVFYLLQFFENLKVLAGNVRKFREAEIWSAACYITPRGPPAMVQQHRLEVFLCQVPEEGATPDAATCHQRLHPDSAGCHRRYNDLLNLPRVEFTHTHLVREGPSGCCIPNQLDTLSAQNHAKPLDASLSAAGAHAKTGGMLDLIN